MNAKPLLSLVACLVLATALPASEPSGSAIQASATLITPHDIRVTWKDPVPGAVGHTVEWTMNLEHDYTILVFLPAGVTSYTHPRLMPDTTCYYRVRPYYGPASEAVSLSLPQGLSDKDFAERFAKPENFEWAGPVTVASNGASTKKSIRSASSAEDARPTHFQAALVSTTVSGFKMTWTDRASDAEGQMIEMKPAGASEYIVRALVEPGVNSFGWAFAPPNRQALLRVRPFFYGTPSNVVYLKTGPEDAVTKVASSR